MKNVKTKQNLKYSVPGCVFAGPDFNNGYFQLNHLWGR